MKKLLVFLAVVTLILAMAISVSAAPVLVTLDTLVGGEVESKSTAGTSTSDVDVTIVAAGTMLAEKFKVGAEYGVGSIGEGSGKEDLSLWGAKGGYRFLDLRATKIDGIVALLNIETEGSTLNGTLVGFDATQYLSEKMFLSLSYVTSINGSYESDALGKDDQAAINLLRFKFQYLVTENLGVALGYTSLNYSFDYSFPHPILPITVEGGVDVTLGGPSLGILYKF